MKKNSLVQLLSILIFSFSLMGCGKFLADLKKNTDEARAEDPEDSFDSSSESPSTAFDNPPSDMFEPPSQGDSALLSQAQARTNQPRTNQEDQESPQARSGALSEATPGGTPLVTRRVAPRVTKDDFIDQSQEEGSLWASSGQTNYYFTKNKIRSPGDLISLTIDEELHRTIASEIKRTLNSKEKFMVMKEARQEFRAEALSGKSGGSVLAKNDASVAQTPADRLPSSNSEAIKKEAPIKEVTQDIGNPNAASDELNRKANKITLADVDIAHKFGIKTGDTMMGEVLGRYPNGNYKIKGIKRVTYKQDRPRLVSVVGIVKSTDINEDTDKVTPGSLYESQIEISN